MIAALRELVQGKAVLILGYGREGRATWNLLKKAGGFGRIAIADRNTDIAEAGVEMLTGEDYLECLEAFDIVFKSPGIVLPKPVREYSCKIVSETELFIRCYRKQIVGITGTKGKSTTTSLFFHILKESGRDCILAGNIGIPVFDIAEQIRPETVVVFEMSCHQLEFLDVSPRIGVLLNIHEEHLDHYGTMEKYVAAKENIFRFQQPGDLFFCGEQCLPKEAPRSRMVVVRDVPHNGKIYAVGQLWPSQSAAADQWPGQPTAADLQSGRAAADQKSVQGQPAQAGTLSDAVLNLPDAAVLCGNEISYRGRHYVIDPAKTPLPGHHNYYDITFVYAMCQEFGITDEEFTAALSTYQTLPHRLQYIGTRNGVKYYDDSISTIGDTTIQALKTLPDTDTVLIGGMDRGIDYGDLISFLSDSPVPHIILMEQTGKRIYQEIMRYWPAFQRRERLILTDHLKTAVNRAAEVTRPGHSCVLSPASASYGIFKNFEERGDVFAELVFGKKCR